MRHADLLLEQEGDIKRLVGGKMGDLRRAGMGDKAEELRRGLRGYQKAFGENFGVLKRVDADFWEGKGEGKGNGKGKGRGKGKEVKRPSGKAFPRLWRRGGGRRVEEDS